MSAITFFRDYSATSKEEEVLDLPDLAALITTTTALSKGDLPWLKFARFGNKRTDKGSLRHNGNIIKITGLEGDYDGEEISFDAARAILIKAGVLALIYTSPSHTEDLPRWRVAPPFSTEYPPEMRDVFMARLNGLFGGIFSRESWTLSQSYYFGSIKDNPSHRVELIPGTPIDLMPELDASAMGNLKASRGDGPARPIGSEGAYTPASDARLEGFRLKVLDNLQRKAADGQKHFELRSAAITLGGIQVETGFSDTEAIQWVMDRLPDTVLNWDSARETARWGLAAGRLRPIELEDRSRPNGAPPPPYPNAALAQNGADPDDDRHAGADHADAERGDEPPPDPPGYAESLADAAPRTPDTDLITEGAVADAFTRQHRNQLRYDHHIGKWFVWDGTRWRREETKLAYRWAHQKAKTLADATQNAKAIVGAGKAAFAAGVERLAQSDRAFAVTSEIWDTDPWLLGTPAGTVDLRTGVMRPAAREDYITLLVAVAPADTADCPLWLNFLNQACNGDNSLIRFLQQWDGYGLTGSIEEHALLFVHGPGGNGKGVWLNTVSNVTADYSRTAAMDTFIASKNDRHPTDLAALKGARRVVASETEEGRAWSEVRVKQLTGGDRIAARFMRQDFFEYTPQFKLTIIGNHMPELHNVDDAAKRRINKAPFTHKPPVVDPKLEKKLRAEWPGILRWLIDGCLDWQANGLIRPEIVTASTADYFSDQDMLAQWIEDCCERTGDDGFPAKDTLASLLSSWRNYAKSRGEEPGSSKAFGTAMRFRGFQPIKNQHGIRGRGYRGIRVRTQRFESADEE